MKPLTYIVGFSLGYWLYLKFKKEKPWNVSNDGLVTYKTKSMNATISKN